MVQTIFGGLMKLDLQCLEVYSNLWILVKKKTQKQKKPTQLDC